MPLAERALLWAFPHERTPSAWGSKLRAVSWDQPRDCCREQRPTHRGMIHTLELHSIPRELYRVKRVI